MHCEYLQAVLQPNFHFSCEVERASDGAVGNVTSARMFFFILDVRTSLQRPKLVQAHSNKEPYYVSVNLQDMDTWNSDPSADRVTVFPECDARWMHPLDIAPSAFYDPSFVNGMTLWQTLQDVLSCAIPGSLSPAWQLPTCDVQR
jgi:hypothetical protein